MQFLRVSLSALTLGCLRGFLAAIAFATVSYKHSCRSSAIKMAVTNWNQTDTAIDIHFCLKCMQR